MGHVILERIVLHALAIVGRVTCHHRQRIVEMGRVTEEKHVEHVLEIAARVICRRQRLSVEMVSVMLGLERIVKHVLGIVLGPIRATTVLRPTGRPLRGLNAGHPVEIQQHGFQNIAIAAAVRNRISPFPLHITTD